MTILLVTCLSVLGAGSASVGQSPSPPPSPATTLADLDSLFPSAGEVGQALGLEVEALGVRIDMSPLWEGLDIAPGALLAKRLQAFRSPTSGTDGVAHDAFAGVFVDIDRFRGPSDAALYGGEVATSITDPLADFPTDLTADLVATGSWISDGGFGGSTILVQEGPFIVIVTAAKTGTTELETATETVTRLVLDGLRGEREPVTDPS